MFTHLHVHTEYSLLDGAARIRDVVARAKELGQTALAITDHGVMYGAVQFYKECEQAGIKAIIGCEIYLAGRTRFDHDKGDNDRYHLILLCKNETGYKNLCRIVSRAHTEGFYFKPRADMELLEKYSDGLIALSACLAGRIPRLVAARKTDEAKAHIAEMKRIFGDDYYLELMDHGMSLQRTVNSALLTLAEETDTKTVVTNDAHYVTRENAYAQDILMCIQTGKTLTEPDRMRFETKELYLKTEEELRETFPGAPDAIDRTQEVADKCNFKFEFGKYHLPEFLLPEGETDSAAYLRKLCDEGLAARYPQDDGTAVRQLEYELEMINEMGFTDYFLIVSDFIRFAKESGIPVGPGRGSAAGSIASYCLDITTVDPIKYGLYFERFLNPERVSMPDIDIDFCERRRGEVISYVKNKYGADHVAQIVTFNTLKAKNAVRSVSKVLDLSFQEENALAKEIPFDLHMTIDKAVETSPSLRAMIDNDQRFARVIDAARQIEDMPKDSGTHAAGVVITKEPVEEYVPLVLSKKDGSITTQYTMTTLEELGLLKMDFLGLRNLTVIDDCVKMIQKNEPEFDIEAIPEDDAKTFDLLSRGKTLGVFQMESTGITSVCTGLGPKSIEDITAIIALYRPGPMDSIPRFLASSRDAKRITYKHPLLEPILSVTYGCIVYQEQVIEILRRLAGFSLGQADMIRRAMSKKKLSQIEKEKEAFINGDAERGIEGAVSRGVAPAVADSIYNEILDFANYAFNKAHAVCYAVVTYRTAYLKTHYPREYFAALLTSVLFQPEKVAEYAAECRELGIELLPPDINKSLGTFSVEGGNIRFGLTAVKNLGAKFMENVVFERQNGEFRGFGDFIRRMFGTDLNRRAVEALIKCGAFDGFGHKRTQLIAVTDILLNQETEKKRRVLEGQMSLFGGGQEELPDAQEPVLPELPDFTAEEKASQEFEATGLYLSGHPCDAYRAGARGRGAVSVGEILRDPESYADTEALVLLGTITASKTRLTKKGSQMCAMTVDDGTGSMEVLAFERAIVKAGTYMGVSNTVLITGRLSVRAEGDVTVMADDVTPAAYLGAEEKKPQGAKVYLRLPGEDSEEFTDIRKRITMFPGKDKLICVFPDKKQRSATFSARIEFIEELREILGAENVVVKNGD